MINFTEQDDLAVIEAIYKEEYWEYYGDKFGWEEIFERLVEGPLSLIEHDEEGNERRFYCQGSAYLRSTWRPVDQREESRRRPEKMLSGRSRKCTMSTDNIPGTTNFTVSKLYDGIDYHFRPKTFWETPSDILVAILRNVKGSYRRSMIRDYYAAGKLDELCSELP